MTAPGRRQASRAGVVLGLGAAAFLALSAVVLATATLSTGCTSSATATPGGGFVETAQRCYDVPSHWDRDGWTAVAVFSVPALLCLAALALTPVAPLRAAARWLVAVGLLLGFPLAAFTPYAYPLYLGGVLMAASAAGAHAPGPPAWRWGSAPASTPRW